jgi:hypothetical protein
MVALSLAQLRSGTGMKHMPIGAVSSGPMTTSRARSDRIRQPSACAQKRRKLELTQPDAGVDLRDTQIAG